VGWLGVDSREVKGWQASSLAQPAGASVPAGTFLPVVTAGSASEHHVHEVYAGWPMSAATA
jgi:hypothetical protein